MRWRANKTPRKTASGRASTTRRDECAVLLQDRQEGRKEDAERPIELFPSLTSTRHPKNHKTDSRDVRPNTLTNEPTQVRNAVEIKLGNKEASGPRHETTTGTLCCCWLFILIFLFRLHFVSSLVDFWFLFSFF